MNKNILKNFVFLLSLGFILFGFNFTNATSEEIPTSILLECIAPQILNEAGNACVDITEESQPLVCIPPQIINEIGDTCINPTPVVITCTEPQILVEGVCIDPIAELTPEKVNIHLEIISGTDSLYNNDILVTACDSEGDGVMKVTPYCALTQSGVPSNWAGLWINSIGDFSNDFTNNLYWMWLANLNIDNTNPSSSYNLSAKQYELNSNDQILFYYNTNPLSISVDNLTPAINNVVTIGIKELGLDSSWNPIWAPSLLSKVSIGSDIFDVDENGEYKINISNTDAFTVFGKKDGFINSSSVSIIPIYSNQEENNEEENNGSTSGGGGSVLKSFSVLNAMSFLSSQQKPDGSFGDLLYTDWGAIAVKAGGDSNLQSSVKNYLLNNQISSSIITDYERHAMALMALGINPYDGTNVNYIKEITDSFDGVQIGDKNIFNDDIFGLIVLQNAGYNENDEIIEKIISYIISKQSSNGSWGSVDMTGAGIMALNDFDNVGGVEDAISKAENYLAESQNEDGGFDNSFSTSWATQALSLSNSFNDEVNNAIEYLTSQQEDDGGLIGSDINNRIWATSYAIPAVMKLSWNDILEDFDKEEPEVVNQSGSTNSNDSDVVVENEIIEELVVANVLPEPEITIVPEEIKVEPVKNNNPKIVIEEFLPTEDVSNVITQDLDENNNDLLASAGEKNIFFKDKVIIMTIISVLVIAIGGWLTNKYI